MGSKGRKSAAKLARRLEVQPQESRNKADHVQHRPGSNNLKKG